VRTSEPAPGPAGERMSEGGYVHRAVRSGAVLFIFGSVQFIAAMILVQSQYSGYSLTQNYISDLGGAHSPLPLVFDGSVILLGVCAILGSLLIWSAFPERPSRGVGLGFLLIAGIGAIGVGVFPETTPVLSGGMHTIVSAIAFVGAGIGLTVLSGAMVPGPRWRFSRPFTLVLGVITLVATALLLPGVYLGFGPGGMERLVVAPILLWAIVEGIHIARLPRLAPGLLLKSPG
jgi:hypothetical membrane protein